MTRPLAFLDGNLRWVVLVLLFGVGCAENKVRTSDRAELVTTLDDLSLDAVPVLRQLANVANVKRYEPFVKLIHRIIHIDYWHFVYRDNFASDLRSLISQWRT